MNPGDALDALVAEKVMGWKWSNKKVRTPDPEGWSFRHVLLPPEAEWIVDEYDRVPGMSSLRVDIPRYSQDIEAAWQIVEKLRMSVAVPGAPDSEGCTFSYPTAIAWGVEGKVYEWGQSVPHAICIAALKSVGVQLET